MAFVLIHGHPLGSLRSRGEARMAADDMCVCTYLCIYIYILYMYTCICIGIGIDIGICIGM